jgi:hypothetical protein
MVRASSVRRSSLPAGRADSSVLSSMLAMIGTQVRVAAAFADAVHRALHVLRTSQQRGHRVGHGAAAVVVRVDPDGHVEQRADLSAHDHVDLPGHGSAVGVAQHDGVAPPAIAARNVARA